MSFDVLVKEYTYSCITQEYSANYILIPFVSLVILNLLPEFKKFILSSGSIGITRWHRTPTPFLSFSFSVKQTSFGVGEPTERWTPQRDETRKKCLLCCHLLPLLGQPLLETSEPLTGKSGALLRIAQGGGDPGRHRPETLHPQPAYLELEAVLGL